MDSNPFKYYSNFLQNENISTIDLKDKIIQNIDFRRDNIEIGRGEEKVIRQERRGTAWLSNQPKLTFEYSGKIMKPKPIPDFITEIKEIIFKNFKINFDGILLNYYYDNNSSMGYHSDPIEDKWSNDFMVISLGETREFIFREKKNKENKIRYNFQDGDIIYMFDDCQDRYEHCLKKGKKIQNDIRISMVFKKSISK